MDIPVVWGRPTTVSMVLSSRVCHYVEETLKTNEDFTGDILGDQGSVIHDPSLPTVYGNG